MAAAAAPAPAVHARWTPPPGAAAANGAPDGAGPRPLLLYNSLADAKVPFVPAAGPGSRQVTWYGCGPTVYDSAHLGHARNYVTFDILRRVMEDYFGYDVLFVMNVTDVDDKIILRARRNHLLARFREGAGDAREVRAAAHARTRAAWAAPSGRMRRARRHAALTRGQRAAGACRHAPLRPCAQLQRLTSPPTHPPFARCSRRRRRQWQVRWQNSQKRWPQWRPRRARPRTAARAPSWRRR